MERNMPAAPETFRVLVVIPAYREEKNIGAVVSAVRTKFPYDVLVVNDGSPDGTSAAARDAGAVVLDLPFNLGIGGRCSPPSSTPGTAATTRWCA